MKIAVNTQHLLKDRLEGIGWFAHETLKRIVKWHPEHEFIFIFDRNWDESFIYGPNVLPVRTVIPSRHPFLWYWHYEIDIPSILKKHKPDLFFSPDGWMSLKTDVPTVDVVHDINFMHRGEDFPCLYRRYYQYFFPKYIDKAKRLITVSEYSKKDIKETFGVNSEKIDVVYNGCNEIFTSVTHEVKEEVRERFAGGNPYFIYVGSQNPRKNIIGLLDAFELFKSSGENNYKLVFAGKPMWGEKELEAKLAKMKFREDVIFTGRISTEVLQLVIASSEALVLVSFLEGFGIPVLEAMKCEVPVICSNITSFPEVAGDAAIYADPYKSESIAEAFSKISGSNELREELIKKGRVQREKFSWDNTAKAVWESIEKAI